MPWEVVKRKDTLLGANQPFISVSRSHFGFNAVLSRLLELDKNKRVTIYADTENRKLGFEFHSDDRKDSYALIYQSGHKTGTKRRGMMCSAAGVVAGYDWVRGVAKLESRSARRFVPKQEGNLWVIQLCPAFEIRKARDSKEIPSDAVGIYRYVRENGEIAYIGQGAIKDRLSESRRKDWDFSIIEYSIVEDADERLKWEDYWIERFKEAHNDKLPLYNLQSGTHNA